MDPALVASDDVPEQERLVDKALEIVAGSLEAALFLVIGQDLWYETGGDLVQFQLFGDDPVRRANADTTENCNLSDGAAGIFTKEATDAIDFPLHPGETWTSRVCLVKAGQLRVGFKLVDPVAH